MHEELKLVAGAQDVGYGSLMTNRAMIEAMSNVAGVQADKIGQGVAQRTENPFAWVVVNWKLEVLGRPFVCEPYTVRTWARYYTRVRAFRSHDLLDKDGNVSARCSSCWTAIDLESGGMKRLTDEFMMPYEPEPDMPPEFPDFTFSKIKTDELEVLNTEKVKILRCMMDFNGHVHNSVYLDIAAEALPAGISDTHYDRLEIAFKKEIRSRSGVIAQYGKLPDHPGKECVVIRGEDGEEHAAILMWQA